MGFANIGLDQLIVLDGLKLDIIGPDWLITIYMDWIQKGISEYR